MDCQHVDGQLPVAGNKQLCQNQYAKLLGRKLAVEAAPVIWSWKIAKAIALAKNCILSKFAQVSNVTFS